MSKMVPVNNAGMSNIQDVYGGSSSDGISLTEYYRGGSYVRVSQLQSPHSTKPIPLLSNGATQEISIGMFRGNTNVFSYDFVIAAHRHNSFNLKDELLAVGWDGSQPVEVSITVNSGIQLIGANSSTPAIDASATFDPYSTLRIINHGYIYGRGGTGGRGGRLQGWINPENGGTGGTAIHLTNINTSIDNYGVISGGGGGGGGGAGQAIRVMWSLPGDNGDMAYSASIIRSSPGGGGAPYGAIGNASVTGTNSWDDFGDPPFATTPGYVLSRLEPVLPASGGSLVTGGAGGKGAEYGGRYTATSGRGGDIGEMGQSGHNMGFAISSSAEYVVYQHAAEGGAPGFSVVNPQLVTWLRYGTVKGRMESSSGIFGSFTNGVKLTAGTSIQSASKLPVRLPKSYHQSYYGFTEPDWDAFTHYWGNYVNNEYFSYDVYTSMVDRSGGISGDTQPGSVYANPSLTPLNNVNLNNIGPSQIGSPLRTIVYIAVCQVAAATNVRLYGVADDVVTKVKVNSVDKLSGNIISSQTTQQYSGSFDVPAGSSIIEIWVNDNNGGSGTPRGNLHMFNLQVRSLPYNQVVVYNDQWYVRSVTAL